MVDASSGSSSFRLPLADSLLEGLQLRPVGDYQLAWLNGSVGSVNQVGSAQGCSPHVGGQNRRKTKPHILQKYLQKNMAQTIVVMSLFIWQEVPK